MQEVFQRHQHTLAPAITDMDTLLRICTENLSEKQNALLQQWQLEQFTGYEVDQKTGIIRFKKQEQELGFYIVPIGSWSSKDHSWMWGWANDSLSAKLRSKARTLQEMRHYLDTPLITQESFSADQQLAEALSILSVEWLGAMGWYTCRRQTAILYLALMEHAPTSTLS